MKDLSRFAEKFLEELAYRAHRIKSESLTRRRFDQIDEIGWLTDYRRRLVQGGLALEKAVISLTCPPESWEGEVVRPSTHYTMRRMYLDALADMLIGLLPQRVSETGKIRAEGNPSNYGLLRVNDNYPQLAPSR